MIVLTGGPARGRIRYRAAIALFCLAGMGLAVSALVLPGRTFAEDKSAAEIEFWRSVKDTDNPAEIEAYLKAFPNGQFVALARIRLAKLQLRTAPPPAASSGSLPPNAAPPSLPQPPPAPAVPPPQDQPGIFGQMDLFAEVLDRVRSEYVDKPDDVQLIRSAVDGVLDAAPEMKQNAITGKTIEGLKKEGLKLYPALDLFGVFLEGTRAARKDVSGGTDRKLIAAAITGMLRSLDSKSAYVPDPAGRMACDTGATVGVETAPDEKGIKILRPRENSPAAKSGVRPGDIVTNLNGEPIALLGFENAIAGMCGAPGTFFRATILREGMATPIEIDIVRDAANVEAISYRIEGGDAGYIKIPSFQNARTAGYFQFAVEDIKRALGQKLKGLIIDLRGNKGGLFEQATAVADALLDRGVIVVSRGRNAADIKRVVAKSGGLVRGKSIVILIDRDTGAGAEIVAGCLQDYKRATLVGQKSLGAGLLQTLIPLSGNRSLQLTTGRMYRPSGQSWEGKGIEPDVAVKNPLAPADGGKRDPQLDIALGVIHGVRG